MIITDQKILRIGSVVTSKEEVEKLNLISRLKTACEEAWTNGYGLAAIQIGVPLRFAWFKIGEQDFTLLNPKIVEFKGKEKLKQEGCLSIPNKRPMVPRYYKIKYLNDGILNTARGTKAHIIQHEIDHMDGILNVDKAK